MAPAGGPDAGYAALHFGADAIYLGLARFSARADAENFSLESLSAITAYAHSMTPSRRVYVTLNTLIQEAELPEVAEVLRAVTELGVDALIVQDLGVLRLAREFSPDLSLHASTQLAVHNLAGACAARALGFQRVTLARELTLPEIREIARESGVEIETFVHGALCYSYSGLCLFSSHLRGRSGNRGRCAYLCRENFQTHPSPPDNAAEFPFSMKDMALTGVVPQLARAGVSALKIEGRKKSPLYVAMVTRLYRRLLDGPAPAEELRALSDDVRVVFSRPWTGLYVQPDAGSDPVDRRTMGHRGCPIGAAAGVRRRAGGDWLALQTTRALELHDGLQVDLPGAPRPYGFAVVALRLAGRPDARMPVRVDAGAAIETRLPPGHPPIPAGAPVYCSSSQAVKRAGQFPSPRPGQFRVRHAVGVLLEVGAAALRIKARAAWPGAPALSVDLNIAGAAPPARDQGLSFTAARAAFGQMQNTDWQLAEFQLSNPDCRFVPVSALKNARRQMVAALEECRAARREVARARVSTWLGAIGVGATLPCAAEALRGKPAEPSTLEWLWSLKTDQPDGLEQLQPDDWQDVEELILDVDAPDWPALQTHLAAWTARLGAVRLRLALPAIVRAADEKRLFPKMQALLRAGWRRWEIANLGGMELLAAAGAHPGSLDVAADWPLYTANSAAGRQLREWGITRLALSPEDSRDNWRALLPRLELPAVAIVYQDTPLMLAETCVLRKARCAGNSGCRQPELDLTSTHGDRLHVCRRGCRNVLINQLPLNLWPRRAELWGLGARRVRADFIWRAYSAADTRKIWRALRAGTDGPPGHCGNFDRGMA